MMKMIKMMFCYLSIWMVLRACVFNKNQGRNEFFEIKFKIAEVTCVKIRIMKQANQTITEIKLNRD